jgi:hypothetical protein
MDKIRATPGLVDLDSSIKADKPTIEVDVRREAASELGLGMAQIAGPLRTLVAGQTVGNWRASDDQTYDVNVRLSPESRDTLADLERLPFTTGVNADGSPRIVRLNQLATLREGTGPNQINRRDLTREVAINGNVFIRSTGEVSADIKAALETINFPPGYRYQFGGSTKNMAESFGYAVSALVLAIVFIYMILASQFKSFLQPLALMTSLPLTPDRRGAGTHDVRLLALDVLHHRHRDAHGPGDEERDPAGGFRHPCPRRRHGALRRPADGGARAAAPDPDDDAGHGLRHGAAGLRADRRLGATRADGPGGHRWRHHLVAADIGRGARGVLLHG